MKDPIHLLNGAIPPLLARLPTCGCVSEQPSCTGAAEVQMNRLCPMSAFTPGPGPNWSPCFETDGYYYNKKKKKKMKKVANYFSSGRQKQLTTGVMCWLKSSLVSMSGGKAPSFSARLAGEHPPLRRCWPWLELSCGPPGMEMEITPSADFKHACHRIE